MARPGPLRVEELRALVEGRDGLNGQALLDRFGGLDALAAKISSNVQDGLDEAAVARNKVSEFKFVAAHALTSQVMYGDNIFPQPQLKSFFELFVGAMKDRTLVLLQIASLVNAVLGIATEDVRTGWLDGFAILVAVLFVALVTSINDYSKERQFQALNRAGEAHPVSVVRSGRHAQVDVSEVVVGDVVLINTGDSLPADGIVIAAEQLRVDESSMTGEPEAVAKRPLGDAVLLGNTAATQGTGRMLVLAVGRECQWGRIRAMLVQRTEPTPLQEKLAELAERIGLVGTVAGMAVFVLLLGIWIAKNYVLSHRAWNWHHLLEISKFFLTAVSLIVIAVPEGLPLSVTLSLSYSMRRMMKDNCLVRKLEACETMGGATTICSDKTGTMTENRMSVATMWIAQRSTIIEQSTVTQVLSASFVELFAQVAMLNSTATLSVNASGKKECIGSSTEGALLLLLEAWKLDAGALQKARQAATVLKRVPFSSSDKYMATVVAAPNGKATVLCTGAAEVVVKLCTRTLNEDGKGSSALSMQAALAASEQMAADGLRVIALAYAERAAPGVGEEPGLQELTLVCLVGIKDKLRRGVPAAVHACQRAGVTVRMVTGDNGVTATSIARECGVLAMDAPAAALLDGSDFRAMTDEQVCARLPQLRVLARSMPADKHRLVRLLKGEGEVVAVTGDGTNDAPALSEANVGFCMGSGTGVAKEASAIVLLDDSFASIVNAIKWGRNVYGSIQKFLQFQLTVTVVAVVLAVVGSVIWHEAPLSAVQMLWINMIMDSFASLALATERPTDRLLEHRPYGRSGRIISAHMWRFIVGSAALQLGVVFGLLYGAHRLPWFDLPADKAAWTVHDHGVLRTIVFNCFVMLQLFNLFNARKLGDAVNILRGLHDNLIFWAILALSATVQALIVQFGGAPTSTTPLSARQWYGCVAVAAVMLPWGILLRFVPVHNDTAAAEVEAMAEAVPEPVAEALVPSGVAGEERSDAALRRRRVASTADQRI